jgi:hypothetical protein
MWFGLLFFAGITSSLAMGTPWMGFMHDEFKWSRSRAAWSFGAITLLMGIPTVVFFEYGVFDEYDNWAGTFSLVIFALLEVILFSWVFGIENGWKEITTGADIRLPGFYKFVLVYITPLLLLFVFVGSVIKPVNNDWQGAFYSLASGEGWPLDNGSLIKLISNEGLKESLQGATSPEEKERLEKKLFFTNLARGLLAALFIFIALLVRKAYYQNHRRKRFT